ncbi:hypothetical protein AAFH68_17110 [Flavobacterium sp. CGRL1]
MNSSQTIIAAVNFSDTAVNAATYASGLAKATGSKLVLFNSFTMSVHSSNSRITAGELQKELERASLRLNILAKDLAKMFDIEVECFSSHSFLESEIDIIIENTKADLVVLGMAERSFEQDLIGNTTTSLIKKLRIPVLAVPGNARFKNINKILFARDASMLPLEEKNSWFIQMAEVLKAEVEFFSVDEKIDHLMKQQGEIYQEDHEAFQSVKFIYKSIRSSTVVNEIRNEIKNYGADILVMAPQKYGFWDSLVHISKTRIMASGLDIPLLSISNF